MFTNYFSLEQLLQPFSQQIFLKEYWEEKPLFIARRLPNYYSALFSLKDIESVVCFTSANDFYGEDIILANCKSDQPYQSTNFNETNLNQLYIFYSQGNTIILNALQRRWKPIAELCTTLQSFFSCKVQANMYLTPKNAQGLKPHFDTHDVFILQVEGCKHWHIYGSPISLPLPNIQMQKEWQEDEIGQPLHKIYLHAGDFLYIPRGYIHKALTSESSSLHLTIGIHPFSWSNLIAQVLESVTQKDVRFRKSLPIGFAYNKNELFLEKQLAEMLQLFVKKAYASDGIEKLAETLFQQYPPISHGHFTQLDSISEITLDTVLRKRQDIVCKIVNHFDRVSILFPGNQVHGPKYIESTLRFIANSQESFSVKSIPSNLNDDSKLLLVRSLVEEGLLTIVFKAEDKSKPVLKQEIDNR
ncbi:cupin domain-containing protein [Nostoc sp. CALU 1950]|uniref:cupin domain-containing protein n=1 Tax=Nostoc sp. CALU 1950 TaxID=3104321 RepID=UPI003EB8AB9C